MNLSRLLSPLHQLLAPVGQICLACGRPMQTGDRHYPEVCRTCVAEIPWIRHPRCPRCGRHIGCPDCTRPGAFRRPFILNRSAVAYDSRMREWLAQYKYRGREAYAPLLARMMGQAYKTLASEMAFAQRLGKPWRVDAVAYVPLSSQRLAERGFNQAELLASGAAAAARVPLIALLERARDTEKMSLKNRRQRLNDMRAVFRPLPEASDLLVSLLESRRDRDRRPDRQIRSPLRLLLVDDIYTTGSTAAYCTEGLLLAGEEAGIRLEVYSLTWARS
ncbi:ComF family protein [Paenibacillus zeisoli]|uniref:ComF family protein n=1 Tax=Paenibacillus zeisoli TaxID=2496267 RepID=A0A3S1JQ37_9BACL|nr:ComF family protein [Paenibacillus zeisoli]RUT33281.1 ComF family protein [Paenibacillus zeisoli]